MYILTPKTKQTMQSGKTKVNEGFILRRSCEVLLILKNQLYLLFVITIHVKSYKRTLLKSDLEHIY